MTSGKRLIPKDYHNMAHFRFLDLDLLERFNSLVAKKDGTNFQRKQRLALMSKVIPSELLRPKRSEFPTSARLPVGCELGYRNTPDINQLPHRSDGLSIGVNSRSPYGIW